MVSFDIYVHIVYVEICEVQRFKKCRYQNQYHMCLNDTYRRRKIVADTISTFTLSSPTTNRLGNVFLAFIDVFFDFSGAPAIISVITFITIAFSAN